MTTLISWNVNGLRAAARKGFLAWLDEARPDVLGIQETKCQPDPRPALSLRLYPPVSKYPFRLILPIIVPR